MNRRPPHRRRGPRRARGHHVGPPTPGSTPRATCRPTTPTSRARSRHFAAKVSGHVVSMTIEDNKPVKAGEVLLRIDPRDYQAKVDQAKAAVAVAAASFQAVRSETQLTRETTQAQGEEAAAALEAARVAEQTAEAAVDESRARLESRRAALAAIRPRSRARAAPPFRPPARRIASAAWSRAGTSRSASSTRRRRRMRRRPPRSTRSSAG